MTPDDTQARDAITGRYVTDEHAETHPETTVVERDETDEAIARQRAMVEAFSAKQSRRTHEAEAETVALRAEVERLDEEAVNLRSERDRLSDAVEQWRLDAVATKAQLDEARAALEALGRERNTWARQMAALRDERDTAISASEAARADLGAVAIERDVAQANEAEARAALARVQAEVSRVADGVRLFADDLEDMRVNGHALGTAMVRRAHAVADKVAALSGATAPQGEAVAQVERSSLGTAEAQALRATVSDERAAAVVARAREIGQQRAHVHLVSGIDDAEDCPDILAGAGHCSLPQEPDEDDGGWEPLSNPAPQAAGDDALRERIAAALIDALGFAWNAEPGVPSPREVVDDAVSGVLAVLNEDGAR